MKIPKDRIQQGVELSIANSGRYVEDCKVLLQSKSLSHAVVMAIFACEEFAKAGFLLECLEKQKKEGIVEVNKKIFSSHEFKIQYARKLGLTLIMESSRLGYARLPFKLGGEDVVASPELRLDCAFVDYKDGKWNLGTDSQMSSIQQFLYEIEEKLKHLKNRINA